MKPQLLGHEIKSIAEEFGYDSKVIRAILMVESSGRGFTDKGVIKIQFEPHHFKDKLITNGVGNQAEEWRAFDEAYKINKEAAYRATSWGLGQIMGFNHKLCGFATAEAMVKNFAESEANQLRGMLTFISKNKQLHLAVKAKNWKVIANFYNGPAYYRLQYDIKLEEAFNSIK